MTIEKIMERAEAYPNWFLTERGTVRLKVDYFRWDVCPLGAAFKTSMCAAGKAAAASDPSFETIHSIRTMIAAADNEVDSPYWDNELRERMLKNCTRQPELSFA